MHGWWPLHRLRPNRGSGERASDRLRRDASTGALRIGGKISHLYCRPAHLPAGMSIRGLFAGQPFAARRQPCSFLRVLAVN